MDSASAQATVYAMSPPQVEPELLDWLGEFARRQGRPLRVLHMGNIANNAYVNAKIMRRLGIEADVLCADYYHTMGCPEWEDLTISGNVGNREAPDWWRAGVRGYRRPRWFAQGPRRLAMSYLAARARRDGARAFLLWRMLEANLWLRGRSTILAERLWVGVLLAAKVGLAVGRRLAARRRPSVPAPCTGASPAESPVPGLAASDIAPIMVGVLGDEWRTLIGHYDIVQGYASEGIYPLASGFPRYAAYEHGTIRDIPFQDDVGGRICAAVYRNAPAVFITNTDCAAAADRLGVPKANQYPVPHAFDSDRTFRFFAEWRPQETVRRAPSTFLAPARQHWSEGYTSWRKGNDVIVKAVGLLAEQGIDAHVVFVEWGKEVDLTRKLIADLDVERHFSWVAPMDKPTLWRTYLQSVGVIDQFVMKAIGSVTFEAMAMGRPVLTALDDAVVGPFFGAVPPICNVHDPEALAAAMADLIARPEAGEELGRRAQDWIARHHSAERILSIHLAAYRNLLQTAAPE